MPSVASLVADSETAIISVIRDVPPSTGERHVRPLAAVLVAASVLVGGCASNTVNMAELRRVVGTESAVRLDAEITDQIRPGAPIPITYEITNDRSTAIAVADIVPESTWDSETRTVTVSIGSEVPGTTMLPRLIKIEPGEKKRFSTTASLGRVIPASSADPHVRNSTLLRIRLNFLADTAPFHELIGIRENAIADSKLADELFPKWLEQNEVVYTNSVPVSVNTFGPGDPDASTERPTAVAPRRRSG
jgi:hypothetical protein